MSLAVPEVKEVKWLTMVPPMPLYVFIAVCKALEVVAEEHNVTLHIKGDGVLTHIIACPK